MALLNSGIHARIVALELDTVRMASRTRRFIGVVLTAVGKVSVKDRTDQTFYKMSFFSTKMATYNKIKKESGFYAKKVMKVLVHWKMVIFIRNLTF